MSSARFDPTFRLVPSRYPTRSLYDRVSSLAEFNDVLEIEAATNPRLRAEAGDYGRKVRAADRIMGPGSTPIIASFVYSGAGRFCDGTFGVYYAALEEETAIDESRHHREVWLRATHEPSISLELRLYTAVIAGDFDDVRGRSMRSALYHPTNDGPSQAYGRRRYDDDHVDGIVYHSVRRAGGTCVVAFRPRVVTGCAPAKYLEFFWDGERQRITSVREVAAIRAW